MKEVKRALISVWDKKEVGNFAQGLEGLGIEILTTGGTARALKEAGVAAQEISDLTGFTELLDGRVKTLHPKIHAGILGVRDNPEHLKQMAEAGAPEIDLVCVNLYPFVETAQKPGISFNEAVEMIDIGGPAMIRSAAKNHDDVAVVTSPTQYGSVLSELRAKGGLSNETRRFLAQEAFLLTSAYDSAIANFLGKQEGKLPDTFVIFLEKVQNLRYGENPHQQAAFYRDRTASGLSLADLGKLHGKELSYNNLLDAESALGLVTEFAEPCAVIVKHTNPCGLACAGDICEAYEKAYAGDPVSAFGGITVVNRILPRALAEAIHSVFMELVIAPDYEPEALELLRKKKNIRLLTYPSTAAKASGWAFRQVAGGMLVQSRDFDEFAGLRVVTEREPSALEWEDLRFAWKVGKHVKSNAIVVAKDKQVLGIGAGQMNRLLPVRLATNQAGEKARGAVLASDGFFPMPDGPLAAAQAGIRAIIQPGGSIKDNEVIAAADSQGLAMVFSGMRHFKH